MIRTALLTTSEKLFLTLQRRGDSKSMDNPAGSFADRPTGPDHESNQSFAGVDAMTLLIVAVAIGASHPAAIGANAQRDFISTSASSARSLVRSPAANSLLRRAA